MSSFETSSPVSASTFAYLIRWPVFLLIWLKLIFSESEVAGYSATGQVTRERRKKPFQLARGAMANSNATGSWDDTTAEPGFKSRSGDSFRSAATFEPLGLCRFARGGGDPRKDCQGSALFLSKAAGPRVRILPGGALNRTGVVPMLDNLSLSELNNRIAILRDNLRQLVEQAAAASG